MKKINVVKSNLDFTRIIRDNKAFRFKDYSIYVERETGDVYKFGISVPKKVGGAVIRNKYKRRIRNIIDRKDYQNGFNCIIIVRKGILDRSYKEMEEDLLKALSILKLVKEES